MSTRIQLLCAWSGPATVVIASIGFLVSGVLPIPFGPDSTTQEVVDFYANDTRVAAGLVILALGFCLVFPLIALIGVFMMRMEGRTPVLTFLQLITGAATGVFLVMPILLMTVIPFRPDRTAELTVTLNDVAWLLFITPIGPFMLQNIAIGTAILIRSPRPSAEMGWISELLDRVLVRARRARVLLSQRPVLVARDLRVLARVRCLRDLPDRDGAGAAKRNSP